MEFKEHLKSKGAREFHIVALSGDENRALAAVAEAESRGAEHVMGYALRLYEDPAWGPTGAKSRVATNLSVDRNCATCGGHLFVPVTEDWSVPYGETWKPCPACNASVDAGFWKANGERFVVAK